MNVSQACKMCYHKALYLAVLASCNFESYYSFKGLTNCNYDHSLSIPAQISFIVNLPVSPPSPPPPMDDRGTKSIVAVCFICPLL